MNDIIVRRVADPPSTSESSLTHSGSSDRQSSVSAGEWEEPYLSALHLTQAGSEYSFMIGIESDRPRHRRLPRRRRREYDSVGLSPDCKLAFAWEGNTITIYSLPEPPGVTARSGASFEGEFKDAALSGRYLITLKRFGLDAHRLSADGRRLTHPLSTSWKSRRNWIPNCVAIFDNGNRAKIAVGGRVDDGLGSGAIEIYLIDGEELGLRNSGFSNVTPLESDDVRRIAFSPDGYKLVCVTKNSRVLIWSWSNNAQSWGHPFQIARTFRPVR